MTKRDFDLESLLAKSMGSLMIVIISLYLFSCGQSRIGNQDSLPNAISLMSMPIAINDSINNAKYKLVTFVDSGGCTSCNLRLYEWARFLESYKKDSLVFIMFVRTPNSEILKEQIKESGFKHVIDTTNADGFINANNLNDQKENVFLLDSKNNVLLEGSPIREPEIRKSFIRIIEGENSPLLSPKTTIDIPNSIYDFGKLKIGESVRREIVVKNIGTQKFVIHNISSDCGCVSFEYPPNPVEPDKDFICVIKFTAHDAGIFRKKILFYCNTQEGVFPIIIKGFVH